MVTTRYKHVFDAPLEKVNEAREKRFEHPDKFPDLKKVKVLEEKKEGKILKKKQYIEISSAIPKQARKFLPVDVLNCIDESVYDLEKNTHHWSVTSAKHKKIFKIDGDSEYVEFEEDGRVKTKREYKISIKVNIPLFAKVAEQAILTTYVKNMKKDCESIKKMLRMMDK